MKHYLLSACLLSGVAIAQEATQEPTKEASRSTTTEKITKAISRASVAKSPVTITRNLDVSTSIQQNLNAVSEMQMGGTEGNGGDAVYQDGELILRDLAASGALKVVTNNKEFLESFPGLIRLIQDIGKVHPEAADAIWSDLNRVNFWLSPRKLPMLPTSYTTTISQRGEVQVAVRKDKDIFIHEKSLDAMESPVEYLFLHEALHGMNNSKNAWDHERVRAVVRYIHENRKNLKREELSTVFSRVKFYGIIDPSLIKSLTRLIVEDYSRDLCLLRSALYVSTASGHVMDSTWKDLKSCETISSKNEMKTLYPQLYVEFEGEPSIHGIQVYSNRSDRKESLQKCKEMAGPQTLAPLKAWVAKNIAYVNEFERIFAEAMGNEQTNWVILHMTQMFGELQGKREKASNGSSLEQRYAYRNYQENVQRCTEVFGPNYLKLRR